MPTASITIRVGSPGWPGSISAAGCAVAAIASVGTTVAVDASCADVSVGCCATGDVGSARNSSAVGAVDATSVGALAAAVAVGAGALVTATVVGAAAWVGAVAGCSGVATPPQALSSSAIRMIGQRGYRIVSLLLCSSVMINRLGISRAQPDR